MTQKKYRIILKPKTEAKYLYYLKFNISIPKNEEKGLEINKKKMN